MRHKLKILTLAFGLWAIGTHAQTFADKQRMLQRVFDDIVAAYGSAKAPPKLILLSNTEKEKLLARYFPEPTPVIKIDEKLVDICREMGPDSLNSLAFLLGHELAHFYADHPWCSDYAFALRNSDLGKILKNVTLQDKIAKESFADSKGLFYAAVAGYKPFGVFNSLIDKIYAGYELKSNLEGYPSKEDRKKICAKEMGRVKNLYPLFKEGLEAIKRRSYDTAMAKFNRLTQEFPSREMYNNAGTAALLGALQLKPIQAKEFIFPIEADSLTRLYTNGTRGENDEQYKKFDELLNIAKKDFEKATDLDPGYFLAKINLASVYDILGNPEAAIGILNQIEAIDEKGQATIVMMKAISYYYSDNDKKLNDMIKLWENKYSKYYTYNYQLLKDN